jgi:uncharacterized protein YbcI
MANTAAQTKNRDQLQRVLSQKVQKLYKNQIGHSPGKVTCQIVDNTVTLIAEDSLTKLERLLIDGEKDTLTSVRVDVEQVRDDLDTAIRPLLIEALQEILEIEVVDILSDTTLETGRTAIVVVLSEAPNFNVNDL